MSLPEASASCRHQWMRDALHMWAAATHSLRLPDGPERMDSEPTPF
jgi:hypothetical protein